MSNANDPSPNREPVTPDFEEFFANCMPALEAFLRAQVGRALAARESISDLAQSACREVLDDLGSLEFRSEDAFRAYLFLQASRKVVDRARFHRMEKRDSRREEPLGVGNEARRLLQDFALTVTPSRAASATEELARVESALEELPERQREAVLLSRVARIDYSDIAEQMRLSPAAVRGLVARGLAGLADRLSP
ncbi:MAG: sigma-70 family RNA polymerase sigma factor [bacterium]|nr:sigma-70 family RNA polymerase sigma factor [bacterium]